MSVQLLIGQATKTDIQTGKLLWNLSIGPKGVRLTKSKALLEYILAQYIDGDDEEPTRSDCVDLYIENAIEKLKAYLFKLLQSQRLKQSKGNKDGT